MNFSCRLTSLILLITVLTGVMSCQSRNEHLQSAHKINHSPRLFLMSKGLVSDTLKAELINFINEDPSALRVAVVVNATSTENKKLKKTNKVKDRLSSIGFDSSRIEMFDLLKRNTADLHKFDIIYILGGNPFNLLAEVRSSGAEPVLEELAANNKVLMGYSAGALLLGPNLDLMNAVDSLLGFNEIALKTLDCLNLYDFLIFPHYRDFTNQVPELIQMINNFEDTSTLEVVRLNDGQGIIIENGILRIVGS